MFSPYLGVSASLQNYKTYVRFPLQNSVLTESSFQALIRFRSHRTRVYRLRALAKASLHLLGAIV